MEKKETGRPSDYKPEYCQEIIDFMADGASLVEFAAHIGVSKQTVHNWMSQYPAFFDSANIARDKCQAWWTKTGRAGIFMGTKELPFNASVYNFTMAARFGWSTKNEVEQKTETTTKLIIDMNE